MDHELFQALGRRGTDSGEADRDTRYMELPSSSQVVLGPKADSGGTRAQGGHDPHRDPGS